MEPCFLSTDPVERQWSSCSGVGRDHGPVAKTQIVWDLIGHQFSLIRLKHFDSQRSRNIMPQDTPIDLTFDVLSKAIAGHAAAIRCRSILQPAAGEGTKVFPPTHSGGVYATERRRIPGREQPVECVLLDSVQSQANRIEEALQDAIDRKPPLIELPLIVVDFGNEVADI